MDSMDFEKLKQFAFGQRFTSIGITVPADLLSDTINEINKLRQRIKELEHHQDGQEK